MPLELRERIVVAVVWARKPRALRFPLGFLVIEQAHVQLLDGEGAVQLDVAASELVASLEGKWKLRLQAGEETFFVSGLAVQEARKKSTRELIERHGARLVAPKPQSISDRHWNRTLTSQDHMAAPLDVRLQKIAWRAALLGLLVAAGSPRP